jgi:hypothetical protein
MQPRIELEAAPVFPRNTIELDGSPLLEFRESPITKCQTPVTPSDKYQNTQEHTPALSDSRPNYPLKSRTESLYMGPVMNTNDAEYSTQRHEQASNFSSVSLRSPYSGTYQSVNHGPSPTYGSWSETPDIAGRDYSASERREEKIPAQTNKFWTASHGWQYGRP